MAGTQASRSAASSVKNGDEGLWGHEENQPNQRSVKHAENGHKLDSLSHSPVFFCAVVEPDDRLGRAGQAADGCGDHLAHRVEHGHHAHVQIPAEKLQGGIADDLHGAIGHRHDKAGKTQGADPADKPPLQAHGGAFQTDHRFSAAEKGDCPQGGDKLGDHRGNGGTLHSQIQHKDKQRVQRDVDHGAQQHGHHPLAAEALGIDKVVHSQPHHHKQAAAEIDGDVAVRVREGDVAGAKGVKQRLFEQQDDCHKGKARIEEHGKCVPHDPFCLFRVPFPILTIITAFANLFGMGGSPLFSIERGKGDNQTLAPCVYILRIPRPEIQTQIMQKSCKNYSFSQTEPKARRAAVVFSPHILYNMEHNFSSGRETAFPFPERERR